MRAKAWELKRGKDSFYYDNYMLAREKFIETKKANDKLKSDKSYFVRKRSEVVSLEPVEMIG